MRFRIRDSSHGATGTWRKQFTPRHAQWYRSIIMSPLLSAHVQYWRVMGGPISTYTYMYSTVTYTAIIRCWHHHRQSFLVGCIQTPAMGSYLGQPIAHAGKLCDIGDGPARCACPSYSISALSFNFSFGDRGCGATSPSGAIYSLRALLSLRNSETGDKRNHPSELGIETESRPTIVRRAPTSEML